MSDLVPPSTSPGAAPAKSSQTTTTRWTTPTISSRWVDTNYCKESSEYGPLADELYVARLGGRTDREIRAQLLGKLKALAARHV